MNETQKPEDDTDDDDLTTPEVDAPAQSTEPDEDLPSDVEDQPDEASA